MDERRNALTALEDKASRYVLFARLVSCCADLARRFILQVTNNNHCIRLEICGKLDPQLAIKTRIERKRLEAPHDVDVREIRASILASRHFA